MHACNHLKEKRKKKQTQSKTPERTKHTVLSTSTRRTAKEGFTFLSVTPTCLFTMYEYCTRAQYLCVAVFTQSHTFPQYVRDVPYYPRVLYRTQYTTCLKYYTYVCHLPNQTANWINQGFSSRAVQTNGLQKLLPRLTSRVTGFSSVRIWSPVGIRFWSGIKFIPLYHITSSYFFRFVFGLTLSEERLTPFCSRSWSPWEGLGASQCCTQVQYLPVVVNITRLS